jgi:hypothetical protein
LTNYSTVQRAWRLSGELLSAIDLQNNIVLHNIHGEPALSAAY